ncbi:MAG TPA: DUF3325 domain-containing protein [Noviherbaspirillum sp.]|nr:DUF3325 domain-containing protein [Noviherbaspirillum sp.]
MTSFLLASASLLGALGGMALLCFQSPNQRHRSRLPEQSPGVRLQFMSVGVALLALSLGSAIIGQGVSFGIVLWICQVGLVGVAMICSLPYYRAWIEPLSRIAAVAAPGLFVAGSYL